MNPLATVDLRTGELVHFDPKKTAEKIAKFDAVVEYAARVNNWWLCALAIKKKIEEIGELVHWWRENVSSAGNPKKKGKDLISLDRGKLNMKEAEELTGMRHQKISKFAKLLRDEEKLNARMLLAAQRKAGDEAEENHRAENTGENEWYTPAQYVEAARQAMGGIDLDPASSIQAQKIVQAEKYFTASDNGLNQEWHGRVWMNPPYAQPLIQHFIEKLIAEARAGRVEQAIVLTHNSTDTLWFHRLESIADRLCFTRGRIAFIDPQADRCSPTQGQTFFYIGKRREPFSDVFREIGFIR